MEPEGGSKRYQNGQAAEGVTEAEGEVTELEAGNMEAEDGVTEAKGGVPKPEVGNMEGEEGVTEAEGGVIEAEAENMEAEGGVMEPHLEEAADCEGGVTEAREVAERWSVWLDITLSINYEAS
ncbi:hypothetical protein R1flu_000733 [Riccia fluitans]|uniref:Uncharacterized protein n=1 Tax=Riccia fluitans TaxID=41844 RepID=A0ABD1Y1B5_9MARC